MIPLSVLMNLDDDPILRDEEKNASGGYLPNVIAIGVLPNGTEQKKPVVVVKLRLADGSVVLGQTTLALMQTAMLAFNARYGVVNP